MTNVVQSIPLEKLLPHPGNCNRMSRADFARLTAHIKRTGRYEPVVVRPDPVREGNLQILNGHHRVEALKKLGYAQADCVVWQVPDDEADVLLATLNRLCGRDDLHKRSELIKRLSRRLSIKEMARLLPDGKKQIERLKALQKPLISPAAKANVFAEAVVFFLTPEQKVIVDRVLKLAESTATEEAGQGRAPLIPSTGRAKRKAAALVKIAQHFIAKIENQQLKS